VTDNNGCTATQTIAITQPASSVSSNISSVNATCGNSNGTASVTAIGGTPGYTYSWSSGSTDATASNLLAGPYTVIITDNLGCTATAFISVNNAGAPTVGIAGTVINVNCAGSATGSATVTASGGTAPLTYSWNNGVTSTTGTATGLTAGTYIVTVTDANGCAQGQTINITQPASALTSSINGQSNVNCAGSATGSATITGVGGTPGYTYLWNDGQTTSTITGLTAGTYSVTVTDNNGCTATQSVAITQPASAVSASISGQGDVNCTGSATGSATITGVGGTPGYTYLWNDGQTTSTIIGLTAGTYSVTVTDNNGCTATQSVAITQPAASVTATTTSTNADCGGSNGTISVSAAGGTPSFTYNWNTGETSSSVSGLTAGSYTVIVTDANGCTTDAIATVNGSPGPTAVVSSKTDITCNGLQNGSATISVSSGTIPYTYTWDPNITTINNPTNLSAATYTVIVNDAGGCKDTVTFTITEPPPITFTITASGSGMLCSGKSVTLTTTTPTGTPPFTFNWLPNGPVVSPLVPTTYSLTVTDGNGCISLMDTILVSPLPSPTAGFDTLSSGIFGTKYFFTDQSTGANTWYWIFGDGSTSTDQNPFHTFPGAGVYTVTQIVTASSGCTDTITKIITIYPNILIPNVFTPNNDGINDEFWIPNTGFESFELNIYDRWGLKLFSTNAGDIRWDGRTAAGQAVPDGTYYYLLTAKLITETMAVEDYSRKGFVDLHK